jgi:uncharacterized Rossmann fold enzyme
MNFIDWEPIYKQILKDFNFDREKDEKAAAILKDLLKPKDLLSENELTKLIMDKNVYIFGAGPDLDSALTSETYQGVLIAADGATSGLLKHDITPDLILTDLDGYIPDQLTANSHGSWVLIHAHGDNIPAIKSWVPKFDGKLLGTTQSTPDEGQNLFNFGGFTDGDRAVFLSAHFKAKKINLVAFDFKKIGEYSYNFKSEKKLRKLTWANLLIGMVLEPPVVFQVLDK